MKINRLSGPYIDCLVATVLNEEEKIFNNSDGYTLRWHILAKPFSTDWGHGGPLIRAFKIDLHHNDDGETYAKIKHKDGDTTAAFGDDDLVAAMRALVIRAYGEYVPEKFMC